jgi:hypothetical protein
MPDLTAVRLLGHLDVEAHGLERALWARERKLLVCLLIAPGDREKWYALLPTEKALSKAKSDLRKLVGSHWIEQTARVYQLKQRPWVDIDHLPADDTEAFDYCCERGGLLRDVEFDDVDWIEEARALHRRRVAAIAARLIKAASSPADIERVLQRARAVLTSSEVQALSPDPGSTRVFLSTETARAEELLTTLEAEMGEAATPAVRIVPLLDQLVDEIQDRAIAGRPHRAEILDRASVLVNFFHSRLGIEVETFVWRLANARMYASDVTGAFAELRPWVERPHASPGVLCIAGLLNMRLGWTDAAHKAFTVALEATPSSPFAIVMREKRDVQLPQGKGANRTELAHQLRDDPLFDELSTGARASIYCNEAKTTKSALNALRLYEKARTLDLSAENPHYELNVARAAGRVGQLDVAREHLGIFNEMLQTQSAISLHYARLVITADTLVQEHRNPESAPAAQRRARLEQAISLYEAVVEGQLRGGEIPRACSSWLKQADIAVALKRPGSAFFYARLVTSLAVNRAERFLPKALEHEDASRAQLDEGAATGLEDEASARTRRIIRGLPAPLLPYAN